MTDRPHIDVVPHLPVLRRYARALTRDGVAADDLVQQALVQALQNSASFDRGRSLRTWLLAIVHNQFISDRRRAGSEQRRLDDLAEAAPTADDGGQEQAVLLRQVAERFAALPEGQRAALHLIAVEGLGYREAAEALGVPIGTVMSRLSRARAALRETPGLDRHVDITGSSRPLRLIGGKDA